MTVACYVVPTTRCQPLATEHVPKGGALHGHACDSFQGLWEGATGECDQHFQHAHVSFRDRTCRTGVLVSSDEARAMKPCSHIRCNSCMVSLVS